MSKNYLKKIIAQSVDDLNFISMCVSGGKVKLKDIKYLPKSKIFLLSINRPINEDERTKRIDSIVSFYYIQSSKTKNIDQNNKDLVLELTAIDVFKIKNNYKIVIVFTSDRFITLDAEAIEAKLDDQKLIDDKNIW